MKKTALKKAATPAMLFILLMGVVSLFSDMTHEGASSIKGVFLSLAGASAATIGFISGLGELVGYSLRLATGVIADRTRKYWPMAIAGYAIDLLAVPALALVPEHGWKLACALIILERAGKAIKKPAKDTLLSFAASREGAGKSYAIQEFFDQIGAFLGPVILFLVLLAKREAPRFDAYRLSFAVLGIPAVITLGLLLYAKRSFPDPGMFEPDVKPRSGFAVSPPFLFYIAAISMFALGFIDFPLVTMHVSREALVADETLPLLYAGAMIVDAFAALLFGWLYDRHGLKVLMLSTALSATFSVFIFGFRSLGAAVLGIMMWGVGMGAQESILKAAVVTMVSKQSRSTGFGIFETAFGLSWFLGSWAMGALYDSSRAAMIVFSVLAQAGAIILFYFSSRKFTGAGPAAGGPLAAGGPPQGGSGIEKA